MLKCIWTYSRHIIDNKIVNIPCKYRIKKCDSDTEKFFSYAVIPIVIVTLDFYDTQSSDIDTQFFYAVIATYSDISDTRFL